MSLLLSGVCSRNIQKIKKTAMKVLSNVFYLLNETARKGDPLYIAQRRRADFVLEKGVMLFARDIAFENHSTKKAKSHKWSTHQTKKKQIKHCPRKKRFF